MGTVGRLVVMNLIMDGAGWMATTGVAWAAREAQEVDGLSRVRMEFDKANVQGWTALSGAEAENRRHFGSGQTQPAGYARRPGRQKQMSSAHRSLGPRGPTQ